MGNIIILAQKIAVILIISFIFLMGWCSSVLAHPHVFIEQKIKVVFNDQGLAGFDVNWKFDDMFTSMIAGDYDKNANGSLEQHEVLLIKKEAFSYLANSDYFTFVKIDGNPFKVKFIQNFAAEIQQQELIYHFFIPCHVSATANIKHVIVDSYDPTYYCDISFSDKNAVSVEQPETIMVKTAIEQDMSTSIYYGQVNPYALFLDFRAKK